MHYIKSGSYFTWMQMHNVTSKPEIRASNMQQEHISTCVNHSPQIYDIKFQSINQPQPLADGINIMDAGRFAGIFAEWGLFSQLSGSPCRTQLLVIRDFTTTCTCTFQHYYAIFMHSACVHVHMYMYTCTCTHVHVHMYMHTYALCGYTRHLRTCRYAAIHVNWPSGISHAAAIAVNHTQGVKSTAYVEYCPFKPNCKRAEVIIDLLHVLCVLLPFSWRWSEHTDRTVEL